MRIRNKFSKVTIFSLALFLIIITGFLVMRSLHLSRPDLPYIAPTYAIPATSMFYGSGDSTLPYAINIGEKYPLIIKTLKIEWKPGRFPHPFVIMAGGELKDSGTGIIQEVQFEEDENW